MKVAAWRQTSNVGVVKDTICKDIESNSPTERHSIDFRLIDENIGPEPIIQLSDCAPNRIAEVHTHKNTGGRENRKNVHSKFYLNTCWSYSVQ